MANLGDAILFFTLVRRNCHNSQRGHLKSAYLLLSIIQIVLEETLQAVVAEQTAVHITYSESKLYNQRMSKLW